MVGLHSSTSEGCPGVSTCLNPVVRSGDELLQYVDKSQSTTNIVPWVTSCFIPDNPVFVIFQDTNIFKTGDKMTRLQYPPRLSSLPTERKSVTMANLINQLHQITILKLRAAAIVAVLRTLTTCLVTNEFKIQIKNSLNCNSYNMISRLSVFLSNAVCWTDG